MKKIITTVLAAVILTGNAAFAKDYPQKFVDVSSDHWAFQYIADLADKGIINGYDDGSFKPENTVSRAEWVKMMVDAAGITISDNSINFNDMSNHWANQYVNATKDYMTGYADNSYKPDQPAVREDVTVSLVNICGYKPSYDYYGHLTAFSDRNSINKDYQPYVNAAMKNNLISGFDDNTFRPQGTLTRAEAAVLLYRAFNDRHKNTETIYSANTYSVSNILRSQLLAERSMLTRDNNDNIYFLVKNEYNQAYSQKLYKTDLNGNNEELIFDIGDIALKDVDVTATKLDVSSICYDRYQNGLLIVGKFKEADYINYNLDKNSLWLLKDNKVELLSMNFPFDTIYGAVSMGYLVANMNDVSSEDWYVRFISRNLSAPIYLLNSSNDPYFNTHVIDIFDAGTEFYVLMREGLVKCEYLLKNSNYYLTSDYVWNIGYLNEESFCGIGDNVCVCMNTDKYSNKSSTLTLYDFSGKKIKTIKENELDFAEFEKDHNDNDYKYLISSGFLFSKNNELIFIMDYRDYGDDSYPYIEHNYTGLYKLIKKD